MSAVTARRTIHQSPLSDAPCVPRGTEGIVEDKDGCTGDLFVDFGEPYGVVLCSPDEVVASLPQEGAAGRSGAGFHRVSSFLPPNTFPRKQATQ